MAEPRIYTWIHKIWYENAKSYRLLQPLAGFYWLLLGLRRTLYRIGLLRRHDVGVPVIVVGNITTGGTGKTPLTIWLARELKARGFNVGIASRGYGGSQSAGGVRVDAASDPAEVGDEPVLLAQRTDCPVVVGKDRAQAAKLLVDGGADLIIADDGLQHYRLERCYEICVIDGARWLGNRRLLPSGPMRESASRLNEVDQVVINGHRSEWQGEPTGAEQNAIEFQLVAGEARRLDGSMVQPLGGFAGSTVHAVAAIGNPARFFDLLRAHDIRVIEHAFADHARLSRKDLDFGDDFDILMTEKDAIKLGLYPADNVWYVPVELEMDPADADSWLQRIESRMRDESRRR